MLHTWLIKFSQSKLFRNPLSIHMQVISSVQFLDKRRCSNVTTDALTMNTILGTFTQGPRASSGIIIVKFLHKENL